MLLARTKLWLIVAIALATFARVGSTAAQDWTPFGPSDTRYDLELFQQPDVSTYGDWPRPNQGFFFQYERLYWAIQQPSRADIGVQGGRAVGFFNGPPQFLPDGVPGPAGVNQPVSDILKPYGNTVDTGFLRGLQTWGNRFELGFMEDDDKGWLLSIMNLQDQIQTFNAASIGGQGGITAVFRDPQHLLLGFVDTNGDGVDDDLNANPFSAPSTNNKVYGVFGRPFGGVNQAPVNSLVPTTYAGFTDFGDQVPLVPMFTALSASNITSMAGVELMRTWRYPPTHAGNEWEMMFGVRWLLMRDAFDVTAINSNAGGAGSSPVALPGVSFWDTAVDNNMVGPQIGFRFDHEAARWDLSTELRFLAAVNFQSTHLNGELASGLNPTAIGPSPVNEPFLLQQNSFHSWAFDETFAPVGELRATVSYKLTQVIAVQAGYNAMLGGGVSRASRRIDYVLPAMQILDAHKNDAWFVNGVNIGITCNR